MSDWGRPAAAAAFLALVTFVTGGSALVAFAAVLAVAFVHGGRRSEAAPLAGSIRELEQHLARCRREERGARLAIVRGGGAVQAARTVRAADSLMLDGSGTTPELVVVADADRLDRAAMETRLREHAGPGVQIAWAAFPEDGYVLADVVAAARRRAEAGTPVTVGRARRTLVPLSTAGVSRSLGKAV